VGVGVGLFVEKSGLGPFDEVRIELGADGSLEIITGVASIGQGVETAMAQVCVDVMGAALASITVTHGQTDRIDRGMGSFATRTTVMTGSATMAASAELRQLIVDTAADILEAAPADLDVADGVVFVVGSPGPSVTFAEVAAAASEPLSATAEFKSDHMTYPYGVHLAVVEVEPDTMKVHVVRFVIGYDVGRAINPMLVEGQLVGAVAQGIGGALFEEFLYDEQGQPLATSFMDYLMPTLSEMAPVEIVLSEDTPSPLNPLGVKGAGEGGITAVGAALAAAIDDALGRPGLVSQLPATPDRLRRGKSGQVVRPDQNSGTVC
jgi:carbon-monoxide dehydrogenase large subunit/6-hydroxypseudooxynicotine dehydrogenase subunit gamma